MEAKVMLAFALAFSPQTSTEKNQDPFNPELHGQSPSIISSSRLGGEADSSHSHPPRRLVEAGPSTLSVSPCPPGVGAVGGAYYISYPSYPQFSYTPSQVLSLPPYEVVAGGNRLGGGFTTMGNPGFRMGGMPMGACVGRS